MLSATFHLPGVLACLFGAPAMAPDDQGVPRLLLDRRLQERPVLLAGIDGNTIRYTDAAGLPRNESITEYLAILPTRAPRPPAPAPPPNPGEPPAPPPALAPAESPDHPVAGPILELTDGQRFAGVMAGEGSGSETIAWLHPILGVLEFRLDQIRRIRLHEGAWTGAAAGQSDLLIFSNGDRLEGFVEAIGARLRFGDLEGKAAPRDLPLDRISEIILANAPAQPSPQAAVAWLRDGSVIACRVIRTTRQGELTLSATLQESEAADTRAESRRPAPALRLDDLLAVSFQSPGASLAPLGALTPSSQEPLGGRRWTSPAAPIDADRAILNAPDLDLPGPMAVTWSLPAGATRLAAQAELPRENWTWGDCELVVIAATPAGPKELLRKRLNADAPTATLTGAFPEGSTALTLRLEPGASGPIQDHVILHRPLLLIGK
jgi:hypothetical protein